MQWKNCQKWSLHVKLRLCINFIRDANISLNPCTLKWFSQQVITLGTACLTLFNNVLMNDNRFAPVTLINRCQRHWFRIEYYLKESWQLALHSQLLMHEYISLPDLGLGVEFAGQYLGSTYDLIRHNFQLPVANAHLHWSKLIVSRDLSKLFFVRVYFFHA